MNDPTLEAALAYVRNTASKLWTDYKVWTGFETEEQEPIQGAAYPTFPSELVSLAWEIAANTNQKNKMITSDSIITEPAPAGFTPESDALSAPTGTPIVEPGAAAPVEVEPTTIIEEVEAFLKTVENESSKAISYLINLLAHHKEVTK